MSARVELCCLSAGCVPDLERTCISVVLGEGFAGAAGSGH